MYILFFYMDKQFPSDYANYNQKNISNELRKGVYGGYYMWVVGL